MGGTSEQTKKRKTLPCVRIRNQTNEKEKGFTIRAHTQSNKRKTERFYHVCAYTIEQTKKSLPCMDIHNRTNEKEKVFTMHAHTQSNKATTRQTNRFNSPSVPLRGWKTAHSPCAPTCWEGQHLSLRPKLRIRVLG